MHVDADVHVQHVAHGPQCLAVLRHVILDRIGEVFGKGLAGTPAIIIPEPGFGAQNQGVATLFDHHLVGIKGKTLRQPNGLAATIPEQARDASFHGLAHIEKDMP